MSNNRTHKRKTKRSTKTQSRHRSNRTLVTGYPSPIKSQPIQVRSLRLSGTGASGVAVNFTLLDLLTSICFAPTTVTYNAIFGSVKLNRITLSVIPTDSQVGTVSFGWRGTRTPTEETTMYYGGDFPCRMTFTPPPESLADFWFNGNSASTDTVETVWTITNTGSASIVMDIEFSYILIDGVGWSNSCSATTLYTIFAARMPRGTSLFVPVGLVNTQVS
jgi:hypothetical protein